MTNYEKYFGRPELAMRSTFDIAFMIEQTDAFAEWMAGKYSIELRLITNMNDGRKAVDFLEWLESEADHA